MHGDLSLINMLDNMNDGKTYQAMKFIKDHIVSKPGSYRCRCMHVNVFIRQLCLL